MKKIVFISVGQPSTNPRLVKEANVLAKAGYEVTVIYSFWTKWAWEIDKLLLSNVLWTPILVGGSPFENRARYFFTRIREKAFNFMAKTLTFKFGVSEIAKGRTYPEMLKKAKAIKADLYIAHIQAALPVAVKAAKKHHAKCRFDAEDFHRHEVSDDTGSFTYKIAKYLEDKYLPELDYLTTSSPQITDAYQQLYPYKKPLTILNVFPKSIHTQQRLFNNCGPIRLFWFSQSIGINRGLDDIAKALKNFSNEDFELHLLGNIDDYARQEFVDNTLFGIKNIIFHKPIPPDDVINFASQFDIGLALEPGFSINNKLALSNKLFTYLQAGLAIIVSDTIAQRCFIEENPEVGKIYQKGDIQSLVTILADYQSNRELLFNTCEASLKVGREKLNWENESLKFLALINGVLSEN